MQTKNPKSKNKLLDWLNQYLNNYYSKGSDNIQQIQCFVKSPIFKIQQLGSGVAYLLLLYSLDNSSVPLRKIQFKTKTQYDNLTNLKLLDVGFGKAKIKKSIDITKLAKMKVQDNLQLLQWFERYIEQRKGSNKQSENSKQSKYIKNSQNQTNLSKQDIIQQKLQQHQQDSHLNQSSNDNSQIVMKQNAFSFPLSKKSSGSQIKIIKQPNAQQIRQNYLSNQYKKTIISKSIPIQTSQSVITQFDSNTTKFCHTFKQKACQSKIKPYLYSNNGKSEIQDDYEGQLKKITHQFNQHKIIDEIAGIIYVNDKQQNVSNQSKLAKIQDILFKNGYGKQKINSTTSINQQIKESHQKQAINFENNHQINQQNKIEQIKQQQKQLQILDQQYKKNQKFAGKIHSFSKGKQNRYQQYAFRQSFKGALNSIQKSAPKTAEKMSSKQEISLFETPTGDNENLLEMSEENKQIISKRRSALKKEDLLFLELQEGRNLLDGENQNNGMLQNSNITKL